MTRLASHLHYRNVDVSTVRELARRWYPDEYEQAPKKEGWHRALGDILNSIEELKKYRRTVSTSLLLSDSVFSICQTQPK